MSEVHLCWAFLGGGFDLQAFSLLGERSVFGIDCHCFPVGSLSLCSHLFVSAVDIG